LLSEEENTATNVEENKPRTTLPRYIYATVGTEFNLYYDSLILSNDRGLASPLNYQVEVICDKGLAKERMYQITPVSGDIGTYTLTVNVYDKNKTIVETVISSLIISDAIAPSSVKNILMVGDSLTASNTITETVNANFTLLGSNVPVFWGTQGSSPNNHEGRGGWELYTFINNGSPFYNGGVLDIANYRSVLGMGTTKFDIVTVQLGVNDCFRNVVQTVAQTAVIIANAKQLIDSFILDNASSIVIIELPTIDGNTLGGWAQNYGSISPKNIYQKNIRSLREAILIEFDKDVYNLNVKVGVAGLGVDRFYGYPFIDASQSIRITQTEKTHTNALHPTSQGYKQIADAIYPQLLNAIQ